MNVKKKKRVLTLVGNPHNVNERGGSNYFFLRAAQEVNFLDLGVSTQPKKLSAYRIIWNIVSWLGRSEFGGFQYSKLFLNRLFAQSSIGSNPTEFISRFQLLPPLPWKQNWEVNYYIDATLRQIFDDYGLAARVGKTIKEDALRREKEGYTKAQRIICMSSWAATSVVNSYNISSSKVHIIPGGANLREDLLPDIDIKANIPESLNPLRLGFIGKNWQRKGLPLILRVAEVLHQRGIAVEVAVMGVSPQDLPKHSLMKPLGFVNKSNDIERFVELVSQFHFGCLFSLAEAFGISNLECLRLGVPVLANRTGGIPDTVPEGLGFLFEPGSSPKIIADLLESFVSHPNEYYQLRDRVAARAEEFTWQRTVEKFIKVWQGSEEFLYDATKR
ncbi:MAG: glycosyl transferase family 1 [Cyanobacteria bacterium QH_9_48_43]|nr:MAG: glycosyl transferase family 1 [Cyanobacteria bacterium QH_9_48_43]